VPFLGITSWNYAKTKPLLSMRKLTTNQFFGTIVTLIMLAAVVAGLVIAGSPHDERMRKADQQRVSDLQQISYSVEAYMNTNGELPPSLEELARSPNTYIASILDPRTRLPYTYRRGENGQYTLCATFETDSDSGPDQPARPQPNGFWTHGVGERCFTLEAKVNTSVYPPLKPFPID
jgi:hypothetical protein